MFHRHRKRGRYIVTASFLFCFRGEVGAGMKVRSSCQSVNILPTWFLFVNRKQPLASSIWFKHSRHVPIALLTPLAAMLTLPRFLRSVSWVFHISSSLGYLLSNRHLSSQSLNIASLMSFELVANSTNIAEIHPGRLSSLLHGIA